MIRFPGPLTTLMLTLPAAALALPSDPRAWEAAPPLTADPAALLAASAAQAPREGSAVLELLEEHLIRVDEGGRKEIRYRYVFRVDQESAIDSWGSVSAEWSPWYEARPEIRARVITPDGQVHLLDPKTIGEYGADDPGSDVYGDRKHLRGPLPKLQKGAIAEVSFLYREVEAFSKVGAAGGIPLAQNVPVVHTRAEIRVPASSPLKIKLYAMDNLRPTTRTADGWTTVSLELGFQESYATQEANLPLDKARRPSLAYATAPSWSAVAREYAEIVARQTKDADLAAWVARATEGATTRNEKIARILDRLHKDVRYTGIEFADAAIVPVRPAEALRRGFGDCKDKSTLLVCLLRTAGIPAEVALLKSGTRPDVDPDLPGSSSFNHAIVYVPGPEPLWIDATADLAHPGQALLGVEGRLALVAAQDTTALSRIPEIRAEDNRQREVREVRFADHGPGTIDETTYAWGMFEARLRSGYVREEDKKIRENLLDYAKSNFSAKNLGKVSYTELRDLSKPFVLQLEMLEASSASIDQTNAAVSVNPWSLVSGIQKVLKEGVEEGKEDVPRRGPLVFPEPYVKELSYLIPTPPGYVPAVLPEDRTLTFGPAALHLHYAVRDDGVVVADAKVDTGRRLWTAAEVDAGLKALKAYGDEKVPQVIFNQVGEAHLAAGRIKEAIAEFRRLAEAIPGKASPHTRVARAYLAAGLGEAARDEAHRAIQLEPTSSLAQETLGWVLEHDQVGRRFAKGWDLPGAVAAYRKAKTLEPMSYSVRGDLAILLEHNAEGLRYGPGADLDASIREYEGIRRDLKNHDLDNNLVLTLAKRGRFADCLGLARSLPSSTIRDMWLVASLVNLQGVEAALKESSRVITDAKTRRTALVNAADELVHLRKYPEATRLLLEGANGSDQMSQLRTRAELIGRARQVEPAPQDVKDPASLVRQFLIALLRPSGKVDQIRAFYSPAQAEYITEAKGKEILAALGGALRGIDLPSEALADLTLSLAQVTAEGDDQKGHRIRIRGLDNYSQTFFVTRTEAGYRLVGTSDAPESMALEAKWLAAHGKLAQARAWLDQARQLVASPPADDPLAGPMFPRFWTKGQEADEQAVLVAASLLLAGEKDVRVTPILEKARREAKDPLTADRLDAALLMDSLKDRNGSGSLESAERLARAYPGSTTASVLKMGALLGHKRWEEALAYLEGQLREHPGFLPFQAGRYEALKGLGRRAAIEKELLAQVDQGSATPTEFNNLAWSQVVRGTVTERTLELVRTATQGTARNSASLHTLSTILAELGRTTEAKEALVQEIELQGLDKPGTNEWYVLGRIAEHLGAGDAAKVCYDRSIALRASGEPEDEDSCAALAARRLKRMKQ
ncbi:MAG TPA: DUF3857 domain-containing protein [Geothrix sp.]|nr:DUF3857 domain-containing protein [Geothrix sp.]